MMAVAARSLGRGSPTVGQASAFSQFLFALSIGVVLVTLALGIVLWPAAMLLVFLLAVAGTVGVTAPRVLAAGLGLAVIGVGLATWLGFTIIIVALLAVGMLAWSAPLYAFALALTIFGAEGSIKAVLSYSATPLSLSPVVLGGVFVDAALVAAVVGLVFADRTALRVLWARLGTLGRISATLLGAWLIGSLVQIPMSASVADAVLGFRLTQGYTIAVVAGVVLAATAGHRAKKIILVAVSPVVLYATLRVVVGPSSAEQVFTSHRPGVTRYGDAVRATGSFSGAVGLVSFLVPVAALAVGLLVSSRRHRLWVSLILVCALTGIVASYTRAALVAVAVGAVFALILLFTVGPPSATRRLVAVTVVALLFAGGAGATVVASSASPQVHRRVDAVVHPERDLSLRMRLATWSRMVDAVWKHPAGSGLGTVGRASGIGDAATVTADQSYLKILREQGLAIGSLFVLGVLTVCLAIVRGLRRCAGEARPLGIAALAGFVSFLILAAFGEYVEQPGKVLAWTLLGIAAWQAHLETEPIP